MGLVGTVNSFLLLFIPFAVLATAHNVHFGRNLLILLLSVLVQILQLFVVAGFNIKGVPFSDIFARSAAAAIIPAVFAFVLRDAKAKKAFGLSTIPDRERVLAISAAAAALVVHHLGPFYYSIGSPGFDDAPLISGVRFNLRLVVYLLVAAALSDGCPLWLCVAAVGVSGGSDEWQFDLISACLTLVLALWFRRRDDHKQ